MDYLLHADLISGNNHILSNGLELRNYKLGEIYDRNVLGIEEYIAYQTLIVFDREKKIKDGTPPELVDRYILIQTIGFLERFIVCKEVKYNRKINEYMVYLTDDEFVFVDKEGIIDIFKTFKEMYCMDEDEKKEIKFASKSVEEAMKEWMEEEEKIKQNSPESTKGKLTLNSIISYVSTKSYTLSLLNIWELTTWQLFSNYKQLSRNEAWDMTVRPMYFGYGSSDTNLEKLRPDTSLY